MRVPREMPMDVNGFCMGPIRKGRADDALSVRPEAETEANQSATEFPDGPLPVVRLLALRRRINARVYDDPRVVDETIRRMIECGDL
jgi:hypothetical protein